MPTDPERSSATAIQRLNIGDAQTPVSIVDAFHDAPDRLREMACASSFEAVRNHYPGIRAPLPDDYLRRVMPRIERVAHEQLGMAGRLSLIDASFSMVTTPRNQLSVAQRLPHCDAFAANRLALIHYLDIRPSGGTAFYRHRSTGFETVNQQQRPILFQQLETELRLLGLPDTTYATKDNALFDQIMAVQPCYNRAVIYPGYQLHSGVIPSDLALSSDPAKGRLTVTGFFSLE